MTTITRQTYSVQKNQGLTQVLQSIVNDLQKKNPNSIHIEGGKVSLKEWQATMNKLAEINEQRKSSGQPALFSGGTDKSKSGYQSSFIIQEGQKIEFSEDELKSLYDSMGVSIKETPKKNLNNEQKENLDTLVNGNNRYILKNGTVHKMQRFNDNNQLVEEITNFIDTINGTSTTTKFERKYNRFVKTKEETRKNDTVWVTNYNYESPWVKDSTKTRYIGGKEK